MTEITSYKASDGRIFTYESECRLHEQQLLDKTEKKIKYFFARTSPDLIEGRGYYKNIYFAVLDNDYCHKERVLTYLFETYGKPIAYAQGIVAMPNWTLSESTKENFIDCKKPKVGDYHHKAEQILISQKPIIHYPDPIWIE